MKFVFDDRAMDALVSGWLSGPMRKKAAQTLVPLIIQRADKSGRSFVMKGEKIHHLRLYERSENGQPVILIALDYERDGQ